MTDIIDVLTFQALGGKLSADEVREYMEMAAARPARKANAGGVAVLGDYIVHTHAKDGSVEKNLEVPLGEGDVLAVAPYTAQVNRLREALDDAGHPDVAVGSVDKFQGAQAPVVIVSMAASNARGGRGSGFVLSRNRLNVAISRAQHTAYLVHAPGLTNVVPSSPKALTALGAFLGVSQAGRRD